jgi:hypothetical protein
MTGFGARGLERRNGLCSNSRGAANGCPSSRQVNPCARRSTRSSVHSAGAPVERLSRALPTRLRDSWREAGLEGVVS